MYIWKAVNYHKGEKLPYFSISINFEQWVLIKMVVVWEHLKNNHTWKPSGKCVVAYCLLGFVLLPMKSYHIIIFQYKKK